MKRLLVDKNLSESSKEFLSSIGYKLIETCVHPLIDGSTSSHPDMHLYIIESKRALVSKELYDYYSALIPDYTFIPVDGIGGKYPNDCILNIAAVGKKVFLTKYQFDVLKFYHTFSSLVYSKQGYSKCSTCVLSDKAILTGDPGIYNIALKNDVTAYFLSDSEIRLDGYKNGFWGGCTGLIDKNKLFFNGNIEKLSCYAELIEILEKEKIEPIYHKETPLYDNGSIILLDI